MGSDALSREVRPSEQRILKGSNTFYGAGLLLGSDAPQARIGCGFNPAGSARIYAPPMAAGRASPLLCRASPIRRARGVLWEVAAL